MHKHRQICLTYAPSFRSQGTLARSQACRYVQYESGTDARYHTHPHTSTDIRTLCYTDIPHKAIFACSADITTPDQRLPCIKCMYKYAHLLACHTGRFTLAHSSAIRNHNIQVASRRIDRYSLEPDSQLSQPRL